MARHDPENPVDELALNRRNFGKIDPNKLSGPTKQALMAAAMCLRSEPGITRAQVTFDDLHGDLGGHDEPPTVHVILHDNIDYWLGEEPS